MIAGDGIRGNSQHTHSKACAPKHVDKQTEVRPQTNTNTVDFFSIVLLEALALRVIEATRVGGPGDGREGGAGPNDQTGI